MLVGPARGCRFVVVPGMGLTYAFAKGTSAGFLSSRIRPGMTVFDVGANKGQMALLFARMVGPTGRVVAFEPVPSQFDALVRNLALNGIATVETRCSAAADADGTAEFLFDADHSTQGKLAAVEPTNVVVRPKPLQVTTERLDTVVARTGRAPDVIKIDVEGGAAAVLAGARDLLDAASPAAYIELHGPEEQAAVHDALLGRGYVAETLTGERVADPRVGWNSALWCTRPTGRASR